MMSSLHNISIIRRAIPCDWAYVDASTGTKFSLGNVPTLAPPEGFWNGPLLTFEGTRVLVDRPEFRCVVDSYGLLHEATPGERAAHSATFSVVAIPDAALKDWGVTSFTWQPRSSGASLISQGFGF
jgi:hypothetical protein